MTEARTPLMIASHKIGVAIGELKGVRITNLDPGDMPLWLDSIKQLEFTRENIDRMADNEVCDEAS